MAVWRSAKKTTVMGRGKSLWKRNSRGWASCLLVLWLVACTSMFIFSISFSNDFSKHGTSTPLPPKDPEHGKESAEDIAAIHEAPWRSRPSVEAGKLTPRVFLFETPRKHMREYGVTAGRSQKRQEKDIQSRLKEKICGGCSSKNCNESTVEVLQCLTCSKHQWFFGKSRYGIGFGHIQEDDSIAISNITTPFKHIDIAVAATGDDDSKLLEFATRLKRGLNRLSSYIRYHKLSVRILVGRHPGDNKSEKFKETLGRAAEIDGDSVTLSFVEIEPVLYDGVVSFNRARALNTLHRATCHGHSLEQCVVTVVDVDLGVEDTFFYNVLALVHPGASIYFPMVFSEFNPETVHLVEKALGAQLPKFSPHGGTWRQHGFGIYAISGVDARNVLLDESFVGWGGEDNAFHSRASKTLNIVRMKDYGLIHKWHPKQCTREYVEPANLQNCINTMAIVEGSALGLYLRSQANLEAAKS